MIAAQEFTNGNKHGWREQGLLGLLFDTTEWAYDTDVHGPDIGGSLLYCQIANTTMKCVGKAMTASHVP
jgi:hypothetical protein